MKKKTDDMKKLTDKELSQKLGHYQKSASLWLLVGLIGVLSGTVSFFAVKDPVLKSVLVTVLFFGGVCCALFLGGGAQKKLKALLQEQMGDFFREEFEKAFGSEQQPPTMRIDAPFLKRFGLFEGQWEECEMENFHEGVCQGVRFSAANLRLDHVYERAIPHEGWETCRETLLQGLAIRLETEVSVSSPVYVHARIEESPRGALTGDDWFDRRFCVPMEEREAGFLTSELIDWLKKTEERIEGRIMGFAREGNTFSLILETDYGFAAVGGNVDLRDLEAVRESYKRSLREMSETIGLVLESPVMSDERSR